MLQCPIRTIVWVLALSIFAVPGQPLAAPTGAAPSGFFTQDWRLNPDVSHIYMQSVKKNEIFETHKFTVVEGTIGADGAASISIDLVSLETGVDLRDVRMRFLFFEVYKFPTAEITAQLDRDKLRDILVKTRLPYTLKFKLKLHGVEKEMEAPVVVTRIVDNAVSVATVQPIIVNAKDFELVPGIAKLSEAVGGIMIAPASSISFDLVFEGANYNPALETARIAAAKGQAQEKSAVMTSEACTTRLDVISKTRAIYFVTGSTNLDQASEPLLNSVAEITNRCPSVKIEVAGHTDADGNSAYNQTLSEQRAKAVSSYLIEKGVGAARIKTAGYGDSQPVAANDTEANKAKNRRIEFRVQAATAAN